MSFADQFQRLQSRNPWLAAVIREIVELQGHKDHDYAGDDPFSAFERAAEYAVVPVDTVFDVLIGIKCARIENLTRKGTPAQYEGVSDSDIDRACYCLLKCAYLLKRSGTICIPTRQDMVAGLAPAVHES